MPHYQHLYEYVYQSLVMQMECGYLSRGRKLPSQAELCQQYNVGITTVRKAVRLLADRGYIRPCAGQAAEIIYSAPPKACAAALLRRRDGILDAYRGLGRLMPALYCAGAQRAGTDTLRDMERASADIIEGQTQQEIYENANRFFRALLLPFKNPLLMDLQSDAEHYLRVPYLPLSGIPDPSLLSAQTVKASLSETLHQARNGQLDGLRCRLKAMYRQSGAVMKDYLDALSSVADPDGTSDPAYDWFSSKGRTEVYVQIAMSLLRRISTGEFTGMEYLPSIPRLMREYGIMKNTASNAVSLLCSLGVTRTLDKRGTILNPDGMAQGVNRIDFQDPTVRQRLVLCLDALQIMALTARSSADTIFPHIQRDNLPFMDTDYIHAADLHPASVMVQLGMGYLIHFAPNHALRNIYFQLNEVMLLGYYLQAKAWAPAASPAAVREMLQTFVTAAKEADLQTFSAALEEAFTYIYRQMRMALSALRYPDLPAEL